MDFSHGGPDYAWQNQDMLNLWRPLNNLGKWIRIRVKRLGSGKNVIGFPAELAEVNIFGEIFFVFVWKVSNPVNNLDPKIYENHPSPLMLQFYFIFLPKASKINCFCYLVVSLLFMPYPVFTSEAFNEFFGTKNLPNPLTSAL